MSMVACDYLDCKNNRALPMNHRVCQLRFIRFSPSLGCLDYVKGELITTRNYAVPIFNRSVYVKKKKDVKV